MKKEILLPNNTFGALIMLSLMLLIFAVPLCLTIWLVSLVAPWWVYFPCGLFVALVATLFLVKFK
jgi:hypothetical protein